MVFVSEENNGIYRAISKSISITPNHVKFIEQEKINLTEFVRSKLDCEIKKRYMNEVKIEKENKKNKFQVYGQNIILFFIGVMFLIMSATPKTFLAWLILFGLGLGIVVYVMYMVIIEVKHGR